MHLVVIFCGVVHAQ